MKYFKNIYEIFKDYFAMILIIHTLFNIDIIEA